MQSELQSPASPLPPPASRVAAAAAPPQPIVRIAALVARMQTAFPMCALSLGWLARWAQEQLALLRAWAGQAREIEGEVQTAADVLEGALAGDGIVDPAEALRLRAALRKPQRHAHQLAAALTP